MTLGAEEVPVLSLGRRRRVDLNDDQGTGDSTGSVTHLSVRLMANDAAGVIRALSLGRTDVLGRSMGGFIAQELTLDHPGMVQRLILASTDSGSPRATTGTPADRLQPGVSAQWFNPPAGTKAAQKTATRKLWLGSGEGTYSQLPKLLAPTLVAYGADGVIVPDVVPGSGDDGQGVHCVSG